MKKKNSIALPLLLIIGLSLLLYPTVSNYWNSMHQSRAIAGYRETVSTLDKAEYDEIWSDALNYNKNINRLNVSELTDAQRQEYLQQLDVTGNGIMGYIDIPDINCSLPVYHGTSESVLQVAVGHLEGSSLPVGGKGSHCVLSGHRGLPSAKLFTNLDQLKEGDVFFLSILDEQLAYEVDQISVVLPEDVAQLTFVDGQDYCTLVTCTPYGVNSHRLLVRGHRIANETVTVKRVTADATEIENLWTTLAVCLPLFLPPIVFLLFRRKKRK